MNKWPKVSLSEVCDFTVGYVSSMTHEYVDDGIVFLRSQNILPYKLDLEDVKYINETFHKKLSKSALNPGDVVVIRTGYPGTACVIPETLKISNCADLVIIRPSQMIDPHFISAIFNSAWGRNVVSGSLVGAAQQHFNVGAAKAMEISLPPIAIQKSISRILRNFNKLIELNEHRILKLETIAKVLYREWFINYRFPACKNIEIVSAENEEFGEIPKICSIKKLGDLVAIRRGQSITRSTISSGNVPVVAGGLKPAYYHNESNTSKPVITISASGANAGYVEFYGVNVWASDCSVIDSRSTNFPHYLYLLLKDKQIEITRLQRGSAQPHVYPKDLSAISVLDFPEDIIESFESLIEPIYSLVFSLREQNLVLAKIRDQLLPKLVSGEIGFSELASAKNIVRQIATIAQSERIRL